MMVIVHGYHPIGEKPTALP
jgi:hypothetical protein